jgi:hypothetical protein
MLLKSQYYSSIRIQFFAFRLESATTAKYCLVLFLWTTFAFEISLLEKYCIRKNCFEHCLMNYLDVRWPSGQLVIKFHRRWTQSWKKKRRLNCRKQRLSSVARCFLFKPKLPIWVNFGGPEIGNLDIFYIHLEYFTGIWEIL